MCAIFWLRDSVGRFETATGEAALKRILEARQSEFTRSNAGPPLMTRHMAVTDGPRRQAGNVRRENTTEALPQTRRAVWRQLAFS